MPKGLDTPFRKGDPVSASHIDAVRRGAKVALTVLHRDGMVDSMGILTRRRTLDYPDLETPMLPCQIYMDGGTTSGNAMSSCNRTYKFFALGGTLLGTGQAPLKARPEKMMMVCMSSGSASSIPDYTRIGMCCVRFSGDAYYYKLFDACEVFGTYYGETASGA